LDAIERGQYRPGVKLGRKITTRVSFYVWLPSGQFSPKDGVAEPTSQSKAMESFYLISQRSPELPPKWNKPLGLCGIQLTVDTTGEPVNLKALCMTEPELAGSAIAAVRKWRFKPAKIEGKPFQVTLRVPILFRGSGSSAP
jgi:protein TonB